jgi:DNA mismatch repair protein MSH2
VKVEMLPEMLDEHAVAALAGLLRSLDLLSNLSAHGKFRLSGVPLDHCMRLDSAAMAALNLLPSAQDAHKVQTFEMLCCLNYNKQGTSLFGRFSCKTAMGSRKLMSWIRQPLLDVSLINGRLDVVEGLVQDSTLRAALSQELLKGLPDIQRLLLKFQRNTNKASKLCSLFLCC